MPNLNVTYGDYADDYCEDWAPTGTPALFTAAGVDFAPARFPGYPTYLMNWEQAVTQSAGADTVAHAPYVQEMILQLSWAGLSAADKASLETFYKSAQVNGMAGPFSYHNPVTGPAQPVRFADPALPVMPEVAHGRYQVDLSLRIDLNYPQLVTSGAPPVLAGNRFVLGAVAMPFPVAQRPASGYGIAKPQTLERRSDGQPVIYDKSLLTLQRHKLALVLDYEAFIRLQAFFFSFAHGRRHPFVWYDDAETARTVRLAETRISVTQTGYNRYTTELPLVEEI